MGGARVLVSPQCLDQFNKDGYFVVERALPPDDLEMLRHQCGRYLDQKDMAMATAGTDVSGISHRGKRYFVENGHRDSVELTRFLFGPTMEQIVRAVLGNDAYLFIELFAVKSPHVGMEFGWHQDSGYMRGRPHKPYLTCWCPLDDVTVDNGTLWVLPFSVVDSRDTLPHIHDAVSNDWIGYKGPERGIPIEVPAGSVVVFSSRLLHRTGVNRTPASRRAFLAEYSCEPIVDTDGSLWSLALPFLKEGRRVVE